MSTVKYIIRQKTKNCQLTTYSSLLPLIEKEIAMVSKNSFCIRMYVSPKMNCFYFGHFSLDLNFLYLFLGDLSFFLYKYRKGSYLTV